MVDYEFPIRGMEYDAAGYRRQAKVIKKELKDSKEKLKAGEYLYGFKKSSRVYPQITILLYVGNEEWDGPKALHDIVDFKNIPETLKKMVSNYKINVIDIRKFENTEVFQTDVKQVFDFIRYSTDKEALRKLVESDEYFKHMEEDAFDVVTNYTNSTEMLKTEEYEVEGGKKDMCKAIFDLMEDSRLEGKEDGIEKGIIALVETLKELEQSTEVILSKVMEKFDLTEEKAKSYL